MKNKYKELTEEDINKAKIHVKENVCCSYEILTMKNITKTKIKWLINDIFAYGKFSAIVGDPGVSKSLWLIKIVSCFSRGETLFNKKCDVIGDTLIISPEDDSGDTLKPRLEACNANLERIHFLNKIDIQPKLSTSSQYLKVFKNFVNEMKIKNIKIKLIVVDPFETIIGDVDLNKSTRVRKIFTPIIDFCKENEIALLGIMHLNKTDKKAIYKISGSMGITAITRSVYMVVKDPNNNERRFFSSVKNNYADDTKGYKGIIKINKNNIPFIEVEDFIYDDINEILKRNLNNEERLPPARKQILDYFKSVYPKDVTIKELSKMINKNENNVCQMVKKLLYDNLIEQGINKKYKYVFRGDKNEK